MTILVVLTLMFVLLLSGLPVSFSLGFLGLSMLIFGGFSPLMAPQAILSTLDGFILLAVPLFLLMILATVIIIIFPEIALWLPEKMIQNIN